MAAPVILMGNHVNLIDPFIVRAAFRDPFVALEKASHFQWPVYGLLIRRLGNIPVHADRPISARATLKNAREALAQGISLLVFPEGTRTRTGDLGPFHKGAFYIAQRSGADMVPFTMRGSHAINRCGSLLIHPGTIDFIISPPLCAVEWVDRSIDDLMAAARLAIENGKA